MVILCQVNYQYRHWTVVKNFMAYAAQHHGAELAAATRSHRHQIMTARVYLSDDSLAHPTFEHHRGRLHAARNSGLRLFEHLTVFPDEIFAQLRHIDRKRHSRSGIYRRR
jgi:hypothetical protein